MASVHLDFESEMFLELVSEDGLAILAKGMGLDRLLMKFLKLHSDPHNLVLVIGSSTLYEDHFKSELAVSLSDNIQKLPRSITNEITAKEREDLYLRGGVLFVTSRILVVDMLRKVCPIEKVAGILVYNAHRVNDSSSEAFILRLYREANKTGFIKGFSDCPEQFTTGFCQLERIMKNLFVKHVYLWPRFHAVVNASLERHQPDVVELRQQMTPSMTAIQQSILEIMKACVRELKETTPSLETDEVTVDNCLGKGFDQIIKIQFDPVWNQLSYKTRQLVYDLKMLKTLLYFLTQYDCVTFYSYLLSLRSNKKGSPAFSEHSPWVFMPAVNTLFVKAKERVYGEGETLGVKSKYFIDKLSLEESPKWHLLSLILDEVREERKKSEAKMRMEEEKEEKEEEEINDKVEGSAVCPQAGGVLIVANDERTCYQLRQYLSEGGQSLLERHYKRLLGDKNTVDTDALPKEMLKQLQSKSKKDGQPPAKKAKKSTAKDEKDIAELNEETNEEDSNIKDIFPNFEIPENSEKLEMQPSTEAGSEYSELLQDPILIHPFSSSKNTYNFTKVLQNFKPSVIILYDADIKLTRQIEIFKATRRGIPLRVYFLVYDSSVEEQMYLDSIKKEKQAFQQLIQEKAHMVIPADREGRGTVNALLKRGNGVTENNKTSTRKAGGATQQEDTIPSVIVDMREFRSSLPSVIHKRGIDIIPLTLEVGDYILTPDICVERKSISDLIGSLNSGRLYNQARAMTQHYQKPILLIEFEEGKPFSLQSTGTVSSDVSSQSVASKLVLLTMHFPKLRILWCPTPHFAAELFEELKAGQPQPDPTVAGAIGGEGGTAIKGEDAKGKTLMYNTSIENFLLKLPGINFKNYKYLMNKVKDLQELVSLSKKELEDILGNDVNAQLLWDTLHTKQSLVSSSSSSKTKSKRK